MKIIKFTIIAISIFIYRCLGYEPIVKLNIIDNSFNRHNVLSFMNQIGIKEIPTVEKIMMLETSHLTSNLYKTNHNLFGLRTTKYLKFNDWKESILCYKKWQDKYYKGNLYNALDSHWLGKKSNYSRVLKYVQINIY